MALVRVMPLKNFQATSLSTTDVSTGYQMGGMSSGERMYAALHLTSASLGTTQRMLAMIIQTATASGFGSPATRATFTLSTVHDAQWATPVTQSAIGSTENLWWRANWTLTTAATTNGTWKGIVYVGKKQFNR